MNILAFLPIILMLIVLALLVTLSIVLKKFVTIKITHWLLFIYVGVLLLSGVVGGLFINDQLSNKEKVNKKVIEQSEDFLYEALQEGKLEELQANYLVSEQHYTNYQNNSLKIESTSSFSPSVYIEKKTTDDGEIEAYLLDKRLFIDGIDFTDKLGASFQYEIINETLTIHPPMERQIKISLIKKEFPINQFAKVKAEAGTIQDGMSVLYLRLPKSLEVIEGTDIYLNYVGE
ncbi:hypothetical protein J2Z40_003925 [Cytobacillus eiseniae]|uniref:Uncharacterized protein n=1 Tax=Cytobacillus eiseniae TaxID=762947 RepID=A0ABS4RK71_9BACI|nr:hypothetical protein [Cytobacillus eiseniae]MBP2243309.1 hypothetical protein [Cytobacillus eiseniae]